MVCTICYHLYNLKNAKNVHKVVNFSRALTCNFTKNTTCPWQLFTFSILYKQYQITQASQTEIKYGETIKRNCNIDQYQYFDLVNRLQNLTFLLTKFDIKLDLKKDDQIYRLMFHLLSSKHEVGNNNNQKNDFLEHTWCATKR